jgi:hypothetical protein
MPALPDLTVRDRVFLVLLAIGCSRDGLSPPAAPDAGSHFVVDAGAVDAGAIGDGADASAAADTGAAPTELKVAPAPAEAAVTIDPGDENQGHGPDGWDLCPAGQLTRAPREGRADPPALRGGRYLIYDPQAPKLPPPRSEAQLYFYFGAPPNGVHGLWLDLIRVSGDVADATLALYAVDEICAAPRLLARHALAPVLRADGWLTACAPLEPGDVVEALGLRFEGSTAEIGLDAVRFGPACPP